MCWYCFQEFIERSICNFLFYFYNVLIFFVTCFQFFSLFMVLFLLLVLLLLFFLQEKKTNKRLLLWFCFTLLCFNFIFLFFYFFYFFIFVKIGAMDPWIMMYFKQYSTKILCFVPDRMECMFNTSWLQNKKLGLITLNQTTKTKYLRTTYFIRKQQILLRKPLHIPV
jgi:hypothetical protein